MNFAKSFLKDKRECRQIFLNPKNHLMIVILAGLKEYPSLIKGKALTRLGSPDVNFSFHR